MGAGVDPLVPDQMDTCVPEMVTAPPLNPVSVGQLPITAGITGSEPVVVTGPVTFDPPSAEPSLGFPEPELEEPPGDPELAPLLLSDPPPLPPPLPPPAGVPLELPPDELPAPLEVLLEVLVPVPASDPNSGVLLPLAHATQNAAAEAIRTGFSFRAIASPPELGGSAGALRRAFGEQPSFGLREALCNAAKWIQGQRSLRTGHTCSWGRRLHPRRACSRASEVQVLAFGHPGPLDGFEPLAAFASSL